MALEPEMALLRQSFELVGDGRLEEAEAPAAGCADQVVMALYVRWAEFDLAVW